MAVSSGLTRAAAHVLDVVAPDAIVRDLYSDEGAEVYDTMSLGDDSEVREILRVARRASGSILELACGSGRLALPLARLGRPVVALDDSRRMLELLEARAGTTTGLAAIRTVQGDMAAFELEEEFGLIVLATTSITLLDHSRRITMLEAARRHLAPDGVLLLSVHTALPRPSGAEATVLPLLPTTGSGANSAIVLLSEQVDATGEHREVSVIRLRREGAELRSDAFISRVHLLDRPRLAAEVRAAGFTVRDTITVSRLHGPHALSMLACTR